MLISCFSYANVAYVSWGNKVVLSQSMGQVTLPKLSRKIPIHHIMYLKYKHLTEDDDNRSKLTSFYSISNIVSINNDTMQSSIE